MLMNITLYIVYKAVQLSAFIVHRLAYFTFLEVSNKYI